MERIYQAEDETGTVGLSLSQDSENTYSLIVVNREEGRISELSYKVNGKGVKLLTLDADEENTNFKEWMKENEKDIYRVMRNSGINDQIDYALHIMSASRRPSSRRLN